MTHRLDTAGANTLHAVTTVTTASQRTTMLASCETHTRSLQSFINYHRDGASCDLPKTNPGLFSFSFFFYADFCVNSLQSHDLCEGGESVVETETDSCSGVWCLTCSRSVRSTQRGGGVFDRSNSLTMITLSLCTAEGQRSASTPAEDTGWDARTSFTENQTFVHGTVVCDQQQLSLNLANSWSLGTTCLMIYQ